MKHKQNICFTASVSDLLIVISLSWPSLISFIVSEKKFVVFSNCYRLRKETEICINVGQDIFSTLHSFGSLNISCNIATEEALSLLSSFTTNKGFQSLLHNTKTSNTVSQYVITGVGWNDVRVLFLKKHVLASDSTNMSTFGQSTQLFHWSCAKHTLSCSSLKVLLMAFSCMVQQL
jgi:hypothetical protein